MSAGDVPLVKAQFEQETAQERKRMTKEEFVQKIKELAEAHNRVCIYGAGVHGRNCLKLLRQNNIPVASFVVTNRDENLEKIDSIPVHQVDELVFPPDSTCFILAMKKFHYEEVVSCLKRNGYNHIIPVENDDWLLTEIERQRRTVTAIEVTTKIGCAVNCRFCPQERLVRKYYASDAKRKTLLQVEDYRKCLDHLPADAIMTFSGFVEPFLNPACSDLITLTAANGNRISLHTSLVGMTMEDFDKIKGIPFEYITLHLPDIDGYAKIPVTEEYKAVLDHVLDMKKPDGSPVVQNANCQSTPPREIIELLHNRITYTKLQLIDRAGNLTDDAVAEHVHNTGAIYCPKSPELRRNILLPDGTLVLCCMDFGLQHPIGNLLEQTYDEIRQSDAFTRIMHMMDEQDSKIICRSCSIAKKRK